MLLIGGLGWGGGCGGRRRINERKKQLKFCEINTLHSPFPASLKFAHQSPSRIGAGRNAPTLGSVSNSTFPYSTYGWSQQQKTFAKNECCENACENAANTTPLAEFDAVGTPPTSSGKKPIPLGNRTRSASGMRSVTGRDECGFYPV